MKSSTWMTRGASVINSIVVLLLSTHADRQGADKSVKPTVLCMCVCTVTDFFAQDKASGVKFCTLILWRPGQGISHFGELCSPEAQNRINRNLAYSLHV